MKLLIRDVGFGVNGVRGSPYGIEWMPSSLTVVPPLISRPNNIERIDMDSNLIAELSEEASRHQKVFYLLQCTRGRLGCLEEIIKAFGEAGFNLRMNASGGQSKLSIVELQKEFPHVNILLNGQEVKDEEC